MNPASVERMRFVAHADGVPLLGTLRTSVVIGALTVAGGYPLQPTDRPRSSFRRHPAKSAAFQKTGMPFTATTREGVFVAERLLPPAFAPALSLTPPTLSPGLGQCFELGIARHGCGHPLGAVRFESADTFLTRWRPCLGLTTQARQRARPARPSTGTDCPARTDAGRSA